MSAHGTFATVLTCMDGRIQDCVAAWVRQRAQVDYVDTITEAGMDGCLLTNAAISAAALTKAKISVEKHGSKCIAVVGHAECAGNPVDDARHAADIRRCMDTVRGWKLPGVQVYGLYSKPGADGVWAVEEIA